jgi:hypothetical protein
VSELKWDQWIKMINFIECLRLEGHIEEATANEMYNIMMFFKRFANDDVDEKIIQVLQECDKHVNTNQLHKKIKETIKILEG